MDDTDWFSEDAATFGDRIAGARDAAGMTQGQLAKRLGVKLGTLRDWENDLSEPRANRLSMLSGVLNVSLPWLLTGEGEGPQTPEDLPAGVAEILAEMRVLRAAIRRSGDRLGVLEKRLAAVLSDHD